MKKTYLVLFFLALTFTGFSQKEKADKVSNKGKMFMYWGWNRASYSDSDITFTGKNYNFTLYNVKAKDKPTNFTLDYFNLKKITNPQTNLRIGYFISDNYTVSVGVDHMKYVVKPFQTVKISGEINDNTTYDGIYNNDDVVLSHDFLKLEHTDGLNYVNLELKRFDDISHLIGMNSSRFQLNVTEGFGAGILYPKTDATLLGKKRHDDFSISGWGVSVGAGLNLTFFKHFFIQSDLKYGYIKMPDVKTTESANDRASQSFTFFEKTIVFGAKFRVF